MKARLLTFIDMLRSAGVSITIAETIDAVGAVRLVGIERTAFRDGLAATLVKDEADRPCFDAIFDRCFPLAGKQRTKGTVPQSPGEGDGAGTGRAERQSRAPSRSDPVHTHPGPHPTHQQHHAPTLRPGDDRTGVLSRNRRLRNLQIKDMSPSDIEECELLVAELARRFRAHLGRRQRNARRGRLDVRRTIRRSISRGGVPIEPAFRRRRPQSRDLVAFCDCSHSVTTATRFLVGLLAPAQLFFRRVRLFPYVDRAIEGSIEGGRLVPHDQLDLYARSDFGMVLVSFWQQHEAILNRNTVVLILGDARNNRRPPRADVLARIHSNVRRVVWLNPDPRERWDTGDSVIRTYQRHCDAVLAASTIHELDVALRSSLMAT